MHLVQLQKMVFFSPCGVLRDGAHAVGTSEDELLLSFNRHLPQRFIKRSGGLFVEIETMERLPRRLQVLCSSNVLVVGRTVLLAVVARFLCIYRLFKQLRKPFILFFVKNSAG